MTEIIKENDATQELSFEQALERLEYIVKAMEAGEMPLDEAIAAFQEGMKLSQICRVKLDEAEQKIETLVADANGFSKKPFQTEEV